MRVTGVTSRFLALLDVALILLGILMIALAKTQEAAQADVRGAGDVTSQAADGDESGSGPSSETLDAAAIADFIFVYAGTGGNERGRCYLMDAHRNRLREIRTDSDGDIRSILDSRSARSREPVVMLMISQQGFDWMWSPDRVHALSQVWGVSVVPVYRWE
jgi:hypothetical protein